MPANDFVFMQDSAQHHHIESQQLRIFLKKLFIILSLLNYQVRFKSGEPVPPHSPDFNLLDSVWDILQELAYEGRCKPHANLHKVAKAIRLKWNEIEDQTIKKATYCSGKACSSNHKSE